MQGAGFTMIALLIAGCAGTNQWGEAPAWVNERPRISSDYIGIASAGKTPFDSDAFATAQKRALAELAGQIRVKIEASSILHTTQFQGIAGQNFEERIQSAATEDLEGYELVGRYENETEIWAYYRLNKATYQRILSERKAADLEIAGGHFESALVAQKQGNAALAMDGYIRCLEDLETHWGEVNLWQGAGGEIALDRAALDGISRLMGDMHLEAQVDGVKLSFRRTLPRHVGLHRNTREPAAEQSPHHLALQPRHAAQKRQRQDQSIRRNHHRVESIRTRDA